MKTKKVLRYNKEKQATEEVEVPVVPTDSHLLSLGTQYWNKGHLSENLGCHPDQVDEFRQDAREMGFTAVDFLPDGRAKITCPKQYQEYLKVSQRHVRNSYY